MKAHHIVLGLAMMASSSLVGCGSRPGESRNADAAMPNHNTSAHRPAVMALAAADSHLLALLQNGTVLAWGANDNGQLGNGTNSTRALPIQVDNLTDVGAIAAGSETNSEIGLTLTSPFGGSSAGQGDATNQDKVTITGFSLALKKDGTVWASGHNGYGELGNGATDNSKVPLQVKNLEGVQSVSAGGNFCLALKKDGTVWSWGDNDQGQLGDGTDGASDPRAGELSDNQPPRYHINMVPARVKALTDVIAVATAGCYSSYALKRDGTVWGWGWNGNGELGIGKTSNCFQPVPVKVKNLANVVAITAGDSHCLALDKDGNVWAWGIPAAGSGDSRRAPVKMRIVSGRMMQTERVLQRNRKRIGQLGNGTDEGAALPIRVKSLKGIVAVAAHGDHNLVLRHDGTVWAWGDNSQGELGDGSSEGRNSPVQVKDLTGVKRIAVGPSCCFAWTKDGSVWGWGDNSKGQLGDPNLKSTSLPVRLSSLSLN